MISTKLLIQTHFVGYFQPVSALFYTIFYWQAVLAHGTYAQNEIEPARPSNLI